MADLTDILSKLPIDQIAAQLGVDPDTARQAVTEGGATILGGLQRNAETPEGASALESALGGHSLPDGTVDLDAVDTADGQKILGHIFGGDEQAVAQKLTDEPKTAGIDFGKLLPMLAPIVMGLVANTQKKSGTTDAAAAESSGSTGGGLDLGGMIGGLLGGGSGSSGAGGLDLGGLLGGLLGGRK